MSSSLRRRWSGSRVGWIAGGFAAALLTAVLASVALAQSPELEPPAKPVSLQAAVSHDLVSLSWDDPGDASISGYQILRRDRDRSRVGQFEVLVEDTGSAASAYVDRQVQPETRYNYRVKARNAAGLSRRSNFVRANTPPAPLVKQAKQQQEQDQEVQPDELVTLWTGQLTVGVFEAAAPPVRGYAEWIRQGALAPRDFSLADESYTVLGLFEHGGGLNLVLGRPLPHDFVLELGPRRYESGQSLEPVFVWAGRYWWPDTALDWSAGDQLTVSIILDPSTTAGQRAAAPPSAYLTDLPAAHNGRDPFGVKLVFDEPDLPLTAALLRDQALQVSGGSVLAVEQGRRAKDWLITLQPDGDGPLTVSLPSPADCADAGAVCAADGRMLRGRLTATIAGPPKLTALHVVGATLSPAFDPDTELYTAETALEQVTVEAAADDPSAQLTISPADADPQLPGHQVALAAAGETTIELELQSLTGETARVYWVILSRSAAAPEPPSAGLNALRFSGLPALEFSEQESRFELDAPEDLEQTTVILSRAESEAGVDIFTVRGDQLVVNETDHDPHAPGHQTLLSAWGDTLLLVRVTSGDGRSQRAYVTHLRGQPHSPPATPGLRSVTRATRALNATRDDVPTTLSALSLSEASLTPAFASDVFMYQASVATDVAQVTITATPSAAGATLLLIPADADALQTGHQVNLGAAGSETAIVVIVSNPAGQLNSYLINVEREPPPPASLQSLVVDEHELSPAFAIGVFLYDVAADADVSEVSLTTVATEVTATIEFMPADADANAPGYQVALGPPGTQTTTPIAIIIRSPGIVAHTTYLVTITRAAPDPTDAALSSLSVDGYELTPAFDAETDDYALTVPGNQNTLSVHAVSRSLSAGLSVSPADADPLEPGHQIPLTEVEPGGEPSLTTITLSVTSADGAATRTYTITVTKTAPLYWPVTLELPSGCTLLDIEPGPNAGQWRSTCHAIYPRTGYYIDYSFGAWYRLIVLEESEVTIHVTSNTDRRIVLRDRQGTVLHQRLIVSQTGSAGQSLTRTLAPGTYVIELAQHNSSDGRERYYTMTVTGQPEPRLSALQLTGLDLSDFSSSQLEYDLAHPAGGLAMTTVVATPQAPATDFDVTILPPDADLITPGHQVALAHGEPTEIRVQVVHPASAKTVAYSVTVAYDTELAPTGLTAESTEDGVQLSWLAPARDATTVTGYAILRQHLGNGQTEPRTLVADTGTANLIYVDGTATSARLPYRYQVKALRDGVLSGGSNIAEIENAYPPDATLSTLRIEGYELTPTFSPTQYTYTLANPVNPGTLDIFVEATNPGAEVWAYPADANQTRAGIQIPLTIRPNGMPTPTTIQFAVTSIIPAERISIGSYFILIDWQPTKLKSLSIWAPHIFPIGLTPAFNRSQYHYNANLHSYLTSVQIRSEPLFGTQLLELDHPDAVPNASGWQIDLGPIGPRVVKNLRLVVKSPDRSISTTYTIRVTRPARENATDLAVGETLTGNLAKNSHRWLRLWLTAGDTYRFDLNGIAPTHLRGGVIQGLYDSAGQYVPNTYYSGSRHITYTADYTGAYHLVFRQHCTYCQWSSTFEFIVREEAVPVTSGPPPTDPIELTTMSGWPSLEWAWGLHILKPYERLWYRVTVDRILAFSATLREQLANANLLLFDTDGNVLAESVKPGTAREHVEITLAAGDYYIAVEAQGNGAGGHLLEVQSQAPFLEDLLALGGEFQLLNRPELEDEDFPADTSTIGRILVGSSLTGWVSAPGTVQSPGDTDWYAVDFEIDVMYRIELDRETRLHSTGDPLLAGVYDPDGIFIDGTRDGRDSGAASPGSNERVFYTAASTGTYYIEASGATTSRGKYRLRVARNRDDYSHDRDTEAVMQVGEPFNATVNYPGDKDWIAVELQGDVVYHLDLTGRSLDDPELLGVFDSDGVYLPHTSMDDRSWQDYDSSAEFTAPRTGTYYVAVTGGQNHPEPRSGTYEVRIKAIIDDFADDTSTVGVVVLGQNGSGSAWGELALDGDRDWFAVELQAGTSYFVELRQGTLRDPYLHGVRDADGAFVAQTAGGDGRHWNLTFEPLSTGVYYIDIGGGEFTVGTYGVKVAADDFVANAGTSGVVVLDGSGVGTADGTIQVRVDRDWFAVELQAGRSYYFEVSADWLPGKPLHGLRTADGVFVARSPGGWGKDHYMNYTAGVSGVYYIDIGGAGVAPTGAYTIRVNEIVD